MLLRTSSQYTLPKRPTPVKNMPARGALVDKIYRNRPSYNIIGARRDDSQIEYLT